LIMDGMRRHSSLPDSNPQLGSRRGLSLNALIARRSQFLPFLLKHRVAVLLCIIIAMILLEVIEFGVIDGLGEGYHALYDLIIYVVFVPAIAWLLLTQLNKVEAAREQAHHTRELQDDFGQRLGIASTWDDLVSQIVEYPHRVSPQAEITLFVYNAASQCLQPEAACDHQGQVTLKPKVSLDPDTLPVGSLPQLLIQNGGSASSVGNPAQRYDLPIARNGQQIAVLKLRYLPGEAPTPDEIRVLKSAVPVMALALEGGLLQNLAAEQAAASEAQRQEIAKHLHDTLAQNIGYLRLKLDQLSGENAIREIGAVLQELERMRTIADEAYQQVRNTLDELNPIQAENLATTLFKQASAISQRAGFSLRTNQTGAPRALAPACRQQILYIVREALYNVEKHARASRVNLNIFWLDAELIIKITDDGVGFNPLAVSGDGHYGLWIMQQRAQEIGGTLKVGPADGAASTAVPAAASAGESGAPGTKITLWLPCPAAHLVTDKPAI
jgi:signal transduction histidine kinase